ncbi:MAG: Erv1/Alr family FAD-linked sulfhydryl oxidase [Candidatus Marinimicrobia bacterium]|nr:Erv1/Alr family FAD-linked sulfhydryl oxidase [Candidatus Neomarinimicrobiota bacterium]
MPATVYLDPKVWGPHYWFFLHTLAMTYPHHPNTVTKKKYYEFIQNLPLFLPVEEISGEMSKLIDKYPVTPYLDDRDSFVRWMHFIHNKINEKLEKPQISLNEFFIKYYDEYKSSNEKLTEYYKIREKVIYFGIIIGISGAIYYLYDK